MIKINKRVLAFLMALVLMFSCTAFASAATPESTALKLSYETVSEGGSIMPLATEHTIGSQLNQTYGTTNFENKYMAGSLYWTTSSTTPVRVTVHRHVVVSNDTPHTWRFLLASTNASTTTYSLGSSFPAGFYDIKIEPTGNGWYIGVMSAIY